LSGIRKNRRLIRGGGGGFFGRLRGVDMPAVSPDNRYFMTTLFISYFERILKCKKFRFAKEITVISITMETLYISKRLRIN